MYKFNNDYAFHLGYRAYEQSVNGNDRGELIPAVNPYIAEGQELLRNEWEAGYRQACTELETVKFHLMKSN